MKYLIIIFICFAVLIIACNSSSGTVSGLQDRTSDPTFASSSSPSQKGYGTFTFTMNGKQRRFIAWHSFLLFPTDNSTEVLMLEDGGPGGPGFDFKINRTGSTKFEAGYADIVAPKLLITFFDTTGVSYIGDDMVINVTSLSATRLTGTFSGKFVKEKYQIKENMSTGTPQVIEVTDGKFDLYKQQN